MRNILIIATIFFLSSCSPTKFNKQVLIIPKSYRGEIWIFYDQKHNRGNFKKEGDKITFFVPKDGIIYSKYKPEGIIDQEQYNDDNEKVFITEYLDKQNKIYLDGGSVGNLELPDKKKVNYSSFFAGDKTSLDHMLNKANDYKYIVKKYVESSIKQ
ncbi:DUF6843 domain-containing protein [Chryseobacterium arthrosphaerae]|uniref:DUF6843 domain-containing protein n=1 Tax=Chryseobacterium arthrosphaerae TaxID=651561 RepID=UPI0031D506AC